MVFTNFFSFLKMNSRIVSKRKINVRKKKKKKEGEKRAAHIVALLKNMRATPTSLLLIKRSGTPPSLSI